MQMELGRTFARTDDCSRRFNNGTRTVCYILRDESPGMGVGSYARESDYCHAECVLYSMRPSLPSMLRPQRLGTSPVRDVAQVRNVQNVLYICPRLSREHLPRNEGE